MSLTEKQRKKRMYMTRTMNSGEVGTIVGYRNAGDIDIEFGPGDIVSGRSFSHFMRGVIRSSKYREKQQNRYIGTVSYATNGMKMTCIDYRDSLDVDIRFEDGTVLKNRQYLPFLKGNVKHPHICKRNGVYVRVDD